MEKMKIDYKDNIVILSGITEINDDTLVIDDSLSNEDRKVKFRVLAKNKTTQIRVNYIAIGY